MWTKELWNESLLAYRQGTFAEISLQRARATAWALSWPISWLQILGLFLMGLYAGRRRFFQNLQVHLTGVRTAFWCALPFGVGGMFVRAGFVKFPNLLGAYLAGTGEEVVDTIGYLALSSVYATSIILLTQRVEWKSRLRPLAAVGRMALSNYLFQSLVCTTLFYSYGIGLFGKVGPAAGLCLTQLGIDSRQPCQCPRIVSIVFSIALGDQLHLLCVRHEHLVSQLC
jgi:uncharacterized protein